MKKLFSCLLAAAMLMLAACGYGNSSVGDDLIDDMEKTTKYYSILNDKKVEKGFLVRGLGMPIYGDDIETFGDVYDPNVLFTYGKTDVTPDWRLCQWATRYPFHDINNTTDSFNYRFTDMGEGRYLYENRSKTVEVDTKTGELRLALDANVCFKYPRTAGQEWPHLLMEQYLFPNDKINENARLSTASSVRVKLDARLNSFTDYLGDSADYSLHSAMLLFYFFVSNYDAEAKAFNDMLWFGIPVFDNRFAYTSEQSFPDVGSKDSASEKWIFNMASHHYFNPDNNFYDADGNMLFDKWVNLDAEVLNYLKRAFESAQKAGYMANSKWENLYINGMYLGYELPGTYAIDMSVKNFDILLEQTEK